MQQVSAGLSDVLGMTQWRKEHPQATWAEIEAAVDAQINPLRARGEQTRSIQTTGGEAVQVRRTYGTCPTCGVGFFPPR
jgi:hypothetical protein